MGLSGSQIIVNARGAPLEESGRHQANRKCLILETTLSNSSCLTTEPPLAGP
jgi:hypothetical protein